MTTRKLTYEERVRWFFDNYYESGMEYLSLLENLRDADLDRLPWYDTFIAIPQEVAAEERWTDAEILFVLSGFTDAAPAEYIKTNLIDLLYSYRQGGHFPPAMSDSNCDCYIDAEEAEVEIIQMEPPLAKCCNCGRIV